MMKILIIVLTPLLVMSGCQTFNEAVVAPTAKAAADRIEQYCYERRGYPASRQRWIDQVNNYYKTSNLVAFDCNGDGKPDVLSGGGL